MGGLTEAFRRNGNDGIKTSDSPKIDGVQRHLEDCREQDRIDRDLLLLLDLAEEAAKWQSLVTREGVDATGTLRKESVGTAEDDDGDEGGEEAGADGRLGRVVEDLNEGHTGAGGGSGRDIADAEADGDQEDQAGDGSDVDGHDDRFRGLSRGVLHLLGHVGWGVVAAHAECRLQQT